MIKQKIYKSCSLVVKHNVVSAAKFEKIVVSKKLLHGLPECLNINLPHSSKSHLSTKSSI